MTGLVIVFFLLVVCLAAPGGSECAPCPGPVWLGDQYILWCDGCGLRCVDDGWSEAVHKNAEYECFPMEPEAKCVWKIHAGRPCQERVDCTEWACQTCGESVYAPRAPERCPHWANGEIAGQRCDGATFKPVSLS